jgi:hypothetical protein
MNSLNIRSSLDTHIECIEEVSNLILLYATNCRRTDDGFTFINNAISDYQGKGKVINTVLQAHNKPSMQN